MITIFFFCLFVSIWSKEGDNISVLSLFFFFCFLLQTRWREQACCHCPIFFLMFEVKKMMVTSLLLLHFIFLLLLLLHTRWWQQVCCHRSFFFLFAWSKNGQRQQICYCCIFFCYCCWCKQGDNNKLTVITHFFLFSTWNEESDGSKLIVVAFFFWLVLLQKRWWQQIVAFFVFGLFVVNNW